MKAMKVNLDIFEMYYLLESCFRGSHLRTDTIERFVDEWYGLFTPEQRENLYEWILRDIYNGNFKPDSRLCGADVKFMARFNPDNQYEVTAQIPVEKGNGMNVKNTIWKREAFMVDGKYYTGSNRYVSPEFITEIKKKENGKGTERKL